MPEGTEGLGFKSRGYKDLPDVLETSLYVIQIIGTPVKPKLLVPNRRTINIRALIIRIGLSGP